MRRCAHCGQPCASQQDRCPTCAHTLVQQPRPRDDRNEQMQLGRPLESDSAERPDGDDVWVAVAAFASIAEAGYFAHELKYAEHIPTRIEVDENFDALSGGWSARFVLAAPQSMVEQAADMLHDMIEQPGYAENVAETELESEPKSRDHHVRSVDDSVEGADALAESSRMNWIPIVLTITAGSVVFWGLREFEQRPRIKRHQAEMRVAPVGAVRSGFWKRLDTSSGPWVRRLEDGRGTRELWIDTRRNRATLREDADGDGHFEFDSNLHIDQPSRIP